MATSWLRNPKRPVYVKSDSHRDCLDSSGLSRALTIPFFHTSKFGFHFVARPPRRICSWSPVRPASPNTQPKVGLLQFGCGVAHPRIGALRRLAQVRRREISFALRDQHLSEFQVSLI